MNTKKLYDVTVVTHTQLPVWPGGQRFERRQSESIADGDICNLSVISMSVHTGTHIDSPLHFVDNAMTVAEIPLEQLIGDCVVADFRGAQQIDVDDLEGAGLPEGTQKLLLKTDNSEFWSDPSHAFNENYCALTPAAAKWLADFGVHFVGIDYLSVALYKDPPETVHRILLTARMVLLEGLNLQAVPPGNYRMYCLPLKAANLEGAPARVVLEG